MSTYRDTEVIEKNFCACLNDTDGLKHTFTPSIKQSIYKA